MTYVCQPQVKDLPRDSQIDITCQTCARSWSQSVADMIERRLGAQFVDLLEFATRCDDAFCDGTVIFAYDGKPETAPLQPAMVTPARPRVERLPYPVKAVVRPRQKPLPHAPLSQYALPIAMPPLRPTQAGRVVSVAGR